MLTQRNKLHQTYEILRYSPSIDDNNQPDKKQQNSNTDDGDGQNYDELTSTGSFLSELSDVSATDDDFLGTVDNLHQNKSLSMEFNAIFGTPPENPDRKLAVPSQSSHVNRLEKTFLIRNLLPSKIQISNDQNIGRMRASSPVNYSKKFLHVSDNFSNAKLYETKGKRSYNAMQVCDDDCNPIYEQIIDEDGGGLFRLKNNLKNIDRPKNDDGTLISPTDSKMQAAINSNECQHTFSYRTASRSVLCFLCSKKLVQRSNMYINV